MMKRLSDKLIDIINEQDFCFTPEEMRVVEKSIRKLSDYENTGLEPEEIEKLKEDLHVLDLFKEQVSDVEESIRIAEARRDGRLIVLPCKVGDMVWVIIKGYTFGEVGDDGEPWYQIDKREFSYSMITDFGKTFFLTREEAEKALEAQNGD